MDFSSVETLLTAGSGVRRGEWLRLLAADGGSDRDSLASGSWNGLFDSAGGGNDVYWLSLGTDYDTIQGQYLNRLDGGERDTARVRESMTDLLTVDSCFTTEAAKTDWVAPHGGTLERGAGDFNGGDAYEWRQGDEMSGLSGGDTLGGYCGGNDTLLDFAVLSDWNSREDEGIDFTGICEEVDGVVSGNSRELKAVAERRNNLSGRLIAI